MVLEKQDSGVCLSTTEPSSPTEAVTRPVSFFVDVGAQPARTGASKLTFNPSRSQHQDVDRTLRERVSQNEIGQG